MAHAQATTLILVTNTVSARQWKSELIRRTSLTEDEIGEYSGAKKEIRPVTIATYQVLTTRRKGVYTHLELLDARDWGLIVYDEVHLLPAPDLPDDRRPAGAPPDRPDRDPGARGRPRGRRVQPDRPEAVRRARGRTSRARAGSRPPTASRCGSPCPRASGWPTRPPSPRSATGWPAAPTPRRLVAERLVEQHRGEPTLVIGQYLDQLDELAEHLGAPVIKGETTVKERERLYEAFRSGEIDLLVVSKVANFSDRPARGGGRDPGLGQLRLPAGGGPAPRPAAAPEGRRQDRALLHRSSAATPSTPTSPRTGSGSWPSRATPTASWMRPICDREPARRLAR